MAEHGADLHFGVVDLFLQAVGPALVVLDAIAGHAGVERFTQRLDHCVGHGHVHVAAAALELHVEARHDHDFRRAHDVRERGVELRRDVFDIDVRDVRPGFLQVDERVLQHHLDDALFGRGEIAAFDLGVAAVAAEEIVDDREHQLRLEQDDADAAQRVDANHVEARRHVQRLHVLAPLLHFDRVYRDFRRTAQQSVEVDAEQAREALVDHLERGHAPAHDPHLVHEVEAHHRAGRRRSFGLGLDRARIHAIDEGVDLVLVQYFLVVVHSVSGVQVALSEASAAAMQSRFHSLLSPGHSPLLPGPTASRSW